MQISHNSIDFEQHHRLVQQHERSEQLDLFRQDASGRQQRVTIQEQVNLSAEAQRLSRRVQQQDRLLERHFSAVADQHENAQPGQTAPNAVSAHSLQPTRSASTDLTETDSAPLDSHTRIIKAVIERLTGKKITIFTAQQLQSPSRQAKPALDNTEIGLQSVEASASRTIPAFGLRYEAIERFHEEEYSRFQVQGEVQTRDGRTLGLSLELNLARSFTHEQQTQITAGVQLTDPLVINLNGQAAQLSNEQLLFDLDSDGDAETVPMLASGSGYLAFDRNSNGQIDNGRELFGTQSGDGFADLAAYDEDGNGFIDEGDALFDQLRIWIRREGGDHLLTLAEAGVGALYLGRSETPFSLTDEQNQLLGQIRSSGVFLFEDGRSGSLQQVDLVV